MSHNLHVLQAASVHREEQNRAFLAVSSQRSKRRVRKCAVSCLQPVFGEPLFSKIHQSWLFDLGALAADQSMSLRWIGRHQHP